MPGKRSRFRRSRKTNVELTDRDVTIIQALERHRFLTTDHLLALTEGKSRQGLTRRLRELYDAGYVDRPKAQLLAMAYAEKRPMVYALGNEGADLLSNRFQLRLPDIYWTEKNRRVKEKFVEHTLGVADFLVALEVACREAGNIKVISKDDLLTAAPEATRRKRHPFRWQTRVHWNNEWQELAIVPDAIFGLHYTDRPEGKNNAYFLVEVDRGTMPITRRELSQTSFARKLHSYADLHQRKVLSEVLGIRNFCVLTITTSKERIASMRDAWEAEVSTTAPAGLFLFAEKGREGTSLFDWQNANGERVSIAP